MYHCKLLPFGSSEQLESIELRRLVLRIPLGLDFMEEELQAEHDQWHLAAYQDQILCGILLLKPVSATEVKMRQVAVHPSSSGKGIGTLLVQFSEHFALSKGYQLMTLHARETALSFYQQLHYNVVGNRFEEVGIPHFKMQKILTATKAL
jgi:predicted GNAT family N-acyltransferase